MTDRFSRSINRLNSIVGKIAAFFCLLLVVITVSDVALRYLFSSGSVALQELQWHCFAVIFILGAAYTLRCDEHVRVDIFYAKFTARQRAFVNLLGNVIFLLPFCVVMIWASIPFVELSFNLSEISPDPGGLAYRFLIKSVLPIGFTLLLLQGIVSSIESAQMLRSRSDKES